MAEGYNELIKQVILSTKLLLIQGAFRDGQQRQASQRAKETQAAGEAADEADTAGAAQHAEVASLAASV
jgi:hypothetical protein